MIQQVFTRPFFLSLTIGVPFCTYKLLFGLSAVRNGGAAHPILIPMGWGIIIWACIDLLMNTCRGVLDLTSRRSPFEYCIIAEIGRHFRIPSVFLAFDTLLSFLIICIMLWSGWIATLLPLESAAWSGATTLNLMSLSIVGLVNEVRSVSQRMRPRDG